MSIEIIFKNGFIFSAYLIWQSFTPDVLPDTTPHTHALITNLSTGNKLALAHRNITHKMCVISASMLCFIWSTTKWSWAISITLTFRRILPVQQKCRKLCISFEPFQFPYLPPPLKSGSDVYPGFIWLSLLNPLFVCDLFPLILLCRVWCYEEQRNGLFIWCLSLLLSHCVCKLFLTVRLKRACAEYRGCAARSRSVSSSSATWMFFFFFKVLISL